MNIFISNLNYTTAEEELKELFEKFGEVNSAKIVTDKETGRSRGFAFVEMPDDGAARKAIEELNRTEFKQRTLNIAESQPKENKPRSFGNGGRFNKDRGARGDW